MNLCAKPAPSPGSSGRDLTRLSGTTGLYRVLVGDYRAILMARENSIVFLRFGHRSSIYRLVGLFWPMSMVLTGGYLPQ